MASSQVIQTSQLPTAFETFYTTGAEGQKGLIPQAFNLYGQGTPAAYKSTYIDPLQAAGLYSGAQRVAGLTGAQRQVGQQLGAMGTPSQFQAGTAMTQQAGQGITGLLNQQAQNVNADPLAFYQMGPANQFTGSAVSQYMSPYMQNVVDVQKQQALRDAQQAQLTQSLGAARQGTYGGARQLLATTERERNLADRMGQLQATGSQAAFEQAQRAFDAQRAADLQVAQQNLQAQLGVQQLGATQSLEAQRANQAANLQAMQQRAQAAGTLGTLGSQLGQLGVAQQAADIDRLKTLGAYGDYERAVQQQQRDVDYQNLMNQIQYPETQLEKLSGFIRGVPLTDTVQTTTTPPPSFASQLAGLGLSGLSLYNMLGSGK